MKETVPRLLVTIATYNEIHNLPRLVETVRDVLPTADILVVDDNSPDGTGNWCEEQRRYDNRLTCLHRPGRLGLGTATVMAMQCAIDNGYDFMLNLDADFSHDPHRMPDLLNAVSNADVSIGSRYVPGGRIEGWPVHRRLMSWTVNRFVRLWLGLPAADCSGAFRCYRVEALRRLKLSSIVARGYAFQEKILWRLHRLGCRTAEVPIMFVDRRADRSKLTIQEGARTFATLVWLRFVRI